MPQLHNSSAEDDCVCGRSGIFVFGGGGKHEKKLYQVFDSVVHMDRQQEKLKHIFENTMDRVDVRWGRVVEMGEGYKEWEGSGTEWHGMGR